MEVSLGVSAGRATLVMVAEAVDGVAEVVVVVGAARVATLGKSNSVTSVPFVLRVYIRV